MTTHKYDQLLALLNEANPHEPPFSLTTVGFTGMMANNDQRGNTKITVVPKHGSKFAGNITIYYDRIDLQELDSTVWIFNDTQFDTPIIIDLLNTFRNCQFMLEEDIVPIPLPTMRDGDVVIRDLIALPDSVNWKGQTKLHMFQGFPVIAEKLTGLINRAFAAPSYLS